jgi:hypothetical protein
MTENDITDVHVKRVVEEVGMLPYDWGHVAPKTLIAAAVRAVNAAKPEISSQDSGENPLYKKSAPVHQGFRPKVRDREIND